MGQIYKTIMYLGRRKILNIERYNANRDNFIKYKAGAVFTAFTELEELLHIQALAHQYFQQEEEKMETILNSVEIVLGNKLTETEYHQLADALRDIAKRLNAHADEIDAAKMDNIEDFE